MAKLHTPLCDRLGIRLPIVQAPMAGGPSSPELVAAVSEAGALGSFGFAYTQPETMQRDVEAVRARTHLPFNLNLFASEQPGAIEPGAQRGAIEAVAGYYAELGLPPPKPVRTPYAPDLKAQFAAAEKVGPRGNHESGGRYVFESRDLWFALESNRSHLNWRVACRSARH